MGCGRVGSMVAHTLVEAGHSVAVIDQDESAFRRLGTNFPGVTVTGIGFDRDHLGRANIAQADAFIAVSSGDNSNILAARVARENFGVANVVARIYDPRRALVYQRLGIPTVATVAWTADQILRRVLPAGAMEEWRDPSGQVTLAQVNFDKSWIGHSVGEIQDVTGARVGVITRFGAGIVPERTAIIQDGDLLHILADAAKLPEVEKLLISEVEH